MAPLGFSICQRNYFLDNQGRQRNREGGRERGAQKNIVSVDYLTCFVYIKVVSLSLQTASEGVWGQCASFISPKEAFLSDTS